MILRPATNFQSKRLHNDGKMHHVFFLGKLTIYMAIFNSYFIILT